MQLHAKSTKISSAGFSYFNRSFIHKMLDSSIQYTQAFEGAFPEGAV